MLLPSHNALKRFRSQAPLPVLDNLRQSEKRHKAAFNAIIHHSKRTAAITAGVDVASFTKRGESWMAQVFMRGVRRTQSFPTMAKARAWAAKVETEIAEGLTGKVRNVPASDLLDKYLAEVSPGKKSGRWEQNTIARFKEQSWASTTLPNLSTATFSAWKSQRLKTVKGSTFNRECNLLSNIFSYAVKEWRWMRENPLSNLKRPPNEPPKDRTIADAERDLICLQLGEVGVSGRVRLAFLFALETGMRAGEICRVRKVSGNVLVTDGKTGVRTVPLSPRAQEIIGDLDGFGITGGQLDILFRKARDAAAKAEPSIKEINFHATRHTAATRWAEKLNLLELCAMFGFKPEIAARVYVNLDAKKIAEKLK